MQIIRGTTPTIIINVKDDIDFSQITSTWIFISQRSKVRVDKTIRDITVNPLERRIKLPLSQEDTLNLKEGDATIQVRILMSDGTALSSFEKEIEVLPTGKEGEIEPEQFTPEQWIVGPEPTIERIKLNLIPIGSMPICHASQFDKKRQIEIEIYNGAQPYFLSDEELELVIKKPDGNLVSMDIPYEVGSNSVIFETTEQTCAVAGKCLCELRVTKGESKLGSLNFYLQVESAPDEGGITSQSEINNLARQVHDIVVEELEDNGASDTGYDNTESGLEATNVQDAIDELASATPEDVYTKEESDDKFATKTSLSEVATSGKYEDLLDKPTIAEIDDTQASDSKTYSSNKIDSKFGELSFPATQIVSASGNNLNDYHTPACFFAETGLTNLPTANDNFIILNYYAKWQNASRYNLVQLAVNATNCKTYARVYTSSNNTWKSWLPLFYDATQLVADVEYNQDETDRIRQNIFGLNASKGENGFLKATGVVQANNGYVTTDYIRIYNGQSFAYRIGHGIELPVICFFTGKDKSFIVSAKTVTGIDGYVSGTFTAEQDGYVRITYSKTKNQGYVVFTDNIPDNIRLSISPNNLKNLNVLCLGDSIFGNDGEIVEFLNDTGAVAVNGAFGGTQVSVRTGASDNFRYFDGVNLVTALCTQTWTDQDNAANALSSQYPWITTRLANLKAVDMSKVDCITMDWGTNDYTSGKTIAEIETAYNTVIDLLQQYFPSVRLLIITPIWRYFGAKSDNENGDNKVYNVSTLKEIATAIDNNSKDKRIASLQMYQNMPLSYNTADLYFDSGDSTHLNTTGNKVYSQILIGKLRSMFG